MVMDRRDGGIRPMSFGLRRPCEDDQSGQQTTEANDDGQEPWPFDLSDDWLTLANRAGRQIANEDAQKEVCRLVDRDEKHDRAESGD